MGVSEGSKVIKRGLPNWRMTLKVTISEGPNVSMLVCGGSKKVSFSWGPSLGTFWLHPDPIDFDPQSMGEDTQNPLQNDHPRTVPFRKAKGSKSTFLMVPFSKVRLPGFEGKKGVQKGVILGVLATLDLNPTSTCIDVTFPLSKTHTSGYTVEKGS